MAHHQYVINVNVSYVINVTAIHSLDTVQGPGSIPGGGGSFGSSSVWDQPTPPYASGCFGNLPSMVCVYKSLKNAIHKQPSGQRSFSIAICTSLTAIHHSLGTFCLFVCLFVFYKGRPDQNQAQEQGSAAQCGFSRVNVRAAEYLLWEKLQRIGVHGEFLRGVQALYADVPMALQFEGGMSDTFQSTLGVKQGCPLSPTLFGIYIDDFQAELEAAGADLDLPTLCGVQAPALFYAIDI